MILDAWVAFTMLVGAILGWGILSPIANNNGWAPGAVDNMENGARGWLLWISIGMLLGDAFARALCFSASAMMPDSWRLQTTNKRLVQIDTDFEEQDHTSRTPLLHDHRQHAQDATDSCESQPAIPEVPQQHLENMMGRNLVSKQALWYWGAGSTLLCLICTLLVFRPEIPPHLILVSIAVSFPFCVVIMQSVGETDTAPTMSMSKHHIVLQSPSLIFSDTILDIP